MPRFAPLCALKVEKIADAGLIIAALDERDTHHGWAARLVGRESPPWLVCEPVLAEIAASVGTPEPVLDTIPIHFSARLIWVSS